VAAAFERLSSGKISDSGLLDQALRALTQLHFEHSLLEKIRSGRQPALDWFVQPRSDSQLESQHPQGLVGTYRVQHLAQSRVAAELWQPADHGSVEFIVVPDIAVFEATGTVSLYRASAHRKFHCVAEVCDLAPSEDGAMTFHLSSDLLQAAEYELILIQRNSQGCEREDHFRILIADPHLPPFEPAMAMRRAARL
jgi:hypothetical protein